MTKEEIKEARKTIDNMTQLEMATLYRFAPGHSYFDTANGGLAEYFQRKFQEKGGMTPSVSKSIGWKHHDIRIDNL